MPSIRSLKFFCPFLHKPKKGFLGGAGAKTTKIMASGSITSRQIEGEKVGVVTDFIFLGSKITADSDS